MIRKILFSGLVVLFCCILFFAQLMGADQEREKRAQPTSLPAVGTAAAQNLNELTQVFGSEIPYTSLSGEGRVADLQAGSLLARQLTWQDESGATISAVRPAEAASALRRDELQLRSDTSWEFAGQTLLLAEGDTGACAYYSDHEAAYVIFLPHANSDELLSLIASRMHFPV